MITYVIFGAACFACGGIGAAAMGALLNARRSFEQIEIQELKTACREFDRALQSIRDTKTDRMAHNHKKCVEIARSVAGGGRA